MIIFQNALGNETAVSQEVNHIANGIPIHLGIDDTDSPWGGCTTYVASKIIQFITTDQKIGSASFFLDYPNLIRLNPNIPFRTRGNGAIAIRLWMNSDHIPYLFDSITNLIKESSDLNHSNTQPGLIVLQGNPKKELQSFSMNALFNVISNFEFKKMQNKLQPQILSIGFNGGRGLIGALAAIGYLMTNRDHTFELITYRCPQYYRTTRLVDDESVRAMNSATFPKTFANIDPEAHEVLIAPRGPDPVLYGIRGNSPEIVYDASKLVRCSEPIEQWCIFRSNQGTNQHLPPPTTIDTVHPYMPVQIQGKISSSPLTIKGGHVFIRLCDSTGWITIAAYEPTRKFRDIIRKLRINDEVIAIGSIRPASKDHDLTLNLEAINVIGVHAYQTFHPPSCPFCSNTMTSDGAEKGYKCRKCKKKYPLAEKLSYTHQRLLTPGLYITPPRAFRHLTKPMERYGRENIGYTFSKLPDNPPWQKKLLTRN